MARDRSEKIILKSPREIELLREANQHVAEILQLLCAAIEPGICTWDLEELARKEIRLRGIKSAFLGYRGYPAVLCTSVNEQIVHGIPSRERVLVSGDIIGIDCGVVCNGYVGDAARSVGVGLISEKARRLLAVGQECLELAIGVCTAGHRLSDLGLAIQGHAEKSGYSVVRDFVGHGIGTQMHEEPQVLNYYDGPKQRLRPGLVIAIEPMINEGGHEVEILPDGWTAVTKDRSLSVHFEHSVAITEGHPIILSSLGAGI